VQFAPVRGGADPLAPQAIQEIFADPVRFRGTGGGHLPLGQETKKARKGLGAMI
jgi:hypothetical protein